jgi:hypothetical protein
VVEKATGVPNPAGKRELPAQCVEGRDLSSLETLAGPLRRQPAFGSRSPAAKHGAMGYIAANVLAVKRLQTTVQNMNSSGGVEPNVDRTHVWRTQKLGQFLRGEGRLTWPRVATTLSLVRLMEKFAQDGERVK